jgi:hypothetical protein
VSIEELLRESMEAYSAVVVVDPPTTDSLAEVQRPRRRPHPAVLAGAAAAVVVLAVAIALLFGGRNDATPPASPHRVTEIPHDAIVVQDAKIVVIDARDRSVVRELVEMPASISSLVATPDGQSIYASTVPAQGSCDSTISDLRAGNSTPEVVGQGFGLAMSGDGHHLASSFNIDGHCGGGGNALRVRNLTTGTETTVDALPAETTGAITAVAWTPDGASLLYSVGIGQGRDSHERFVTWNWRTGANSELVVDAGDVPVGYLGDARHLLVLDAATRTQFTVVDLSTRDRRLLFRSPREVGARSVAVDPSGMHLLFVTFGSTAPGTTHPTTLWRWSIGDATPTELTQSSGAAAWSLGDEAGSGVDGKPTPAQARRLSQQKRDYDPAEIADLVAQARADHWTMDDQYLVSTLEFRRACRTTLQVANQADALDEGERADLVDSIMQPEVERLIDRDPAGSESRAMFQDLAVRIVSGDSDGARTWLESNCVHAFAWSREP